MKRLFMKQAYSNNDAPGGSLKNKTGSWRNFYPVVDKAKCIDCATCQAYCPEDCIYQESVKDSLKGNIYKADLDYCKGCGICAEVCPVKCILMQKES